MRIHSILAIKWDDVEGSYFPVASTSSLRPFLTNGILAFRRNAAALHGYDIELKLATSEYEQGKPICHQFTYSEIPSWKIHDADAYLISAVSRYADIELPNDLEYGV